MKIIVGNKSILYAPEDRGGQALFDDWACHFTDDDIEGYAFEDDKQLNYHIARRSPDSFANLPDEGDWVEIGVYKWGDKMVRCIQAHARTIYLPDVTPALFEIIDPVGSEDYPEWKAPSGAHDVYNVGDRVKYNGQVWESTANANVWAPGVYGWIIVNET